jgi:shikimate dehydrogenase
MERLRFALLGHPVRQSVSPAIHAAAIRALGMPHGYSAIDVPSEASLRRLVGEIRRGSFHGVNVTLPYKRSVLEMVDQAAPSAAEVGAANVLCRTPAGGVIAHNTDVAALADELAALTVGRPRLRAVVLGSGGAGLSAVAALRRLGFSVIGVTSHSWKGTETVYESDAAKRARKLGALTMPWPTDLAELPASGKASQVLRMQWSEFAVAADVIVQATSAGMLGGPPGEPVARAVPWTLVRPGAVAYDVVYNPAVTPFLLEASSRGHPALGGLGMLVRQAAASLQLWTGETPPLDVMREAAEQALARAAPAPTTPV